MATVTEQPLPEEYRVIGTTPIRPDGLDKVTGRAIYGADFKIPDVVHGAILRSPFAHALIKHIDTSKAEAVPGVLAVLTAADFPSVEDMPGGTPDARRRMEYTKDQVMAGKRVAYKGHPVAAVAALDFNTALEATKLIEVEYEPLKPVLNVDEAMAPDAPIIHGDLTGDDLGEKVSNTNMANHTRYESGDVEKGFQESTIVVERTFKSATVHQGYIEPHSATVLWDADGRLTVWTSAQGSFLIRGQLAGLLQLPESQVKVVPLEIGGGFGGKEVLYLKPVAALLSKKTNRPVKMVMDRKAEFDATGPTSASKITLKVGVDDAGGIKAATADMRYEAGAYPGSSMTSGMTSIFAPYRIENFQIDGYMIVVNKPKSSFYRAPCATQAAFAMESLIDEVCEQLKMDPLEFRIMNATRKGDRRPDGPVFPRIGNLEVQEAAKESPHMKSKLERQSPNGRLRGRGVATGYWAGGGGRSSVTISINNDGSVSLVLGSVDLGAGTRTVMPMILAEKLGIPLEDVRVTTGDSEGVGYTDGTFGSRTTNATGHATYIGAQNVISLMKERAARVWDLKVEDIEFESGTFSSKADPELKLTIKELAAKFAQTGGPLSATGTINGLQTGGGFATSIMDVEVDPETGNVDVVRATMVQDAGKAIHPQLVEGQMQGGVAQGVGWALHEEYFMNEQGVMANSTLLDYRMPTALDVPMIEAIIVEVPNENHPLGVRGVGETCIIPNVPAIANAIYDAIGVRMQQAPMKPSRILQALKEKNGA